MIDFDWKSVVGQRNFLLHNYRGIDPNIIRDIVNDKLDKLKEICVLLVKKIGIKKEKISTVLNSPYYKNIKYLLNEL